jgi:hypothetical protein
LSGVAFLQIRSIEVSLMGEPIPLPACGIVIGAMKFGAMVVASTLRETSVIYATIMGGSFLDEELQETQAIW